MIITALALLAAAGARPITPSERAIINRAVQPELASPGTIGVGPLPAAATIVCGRVNGSDFKVYITRNAAGRIVAAEQTTVLTDDKPALLVMAIRQSCLHQGYSL